MLQQQNPGILRHYQYILKEIRMALFSAFVSTLTNLQKDRVTFQLPIKFIFSCKSFTGNCEKLKLIFIFNKRKVMTFSLSGRERKQNI